MRRTDSQHGSYMFEIVTLEVTPFLQNARIVFDPASKRAVLIDPGGEADRIWADVQSRGLTCEQIWLTHSHLDHCGGVKRLKSLSGAQLIGHPIEREMRAHVKDLCAMFGLAPADLDNCPEPEIYIQGGETLACGPYRFEVIKCPGHSPGHVAFYQREAGLLISGDVLFKGSIGRTDLPGGNYELLMRSIGELMAALPASTRILPGHGPDTTLAAEAQSNPFILGEVA